MRYAFATLLFLHGVAHLVGFIVPWRPGPHAADARTTDVATVLGGRHTLGPVALRATSFFWLAGAVTFGVVAAGIWHGAEWAPVAVFAASVLSLTLTVIWWPTARIGALVNAALIIAIVGVTWPRYARDLGAARERAAKNTTIMSTAAGPIEYVVAGDGDPILVLHGTGGGWDQGLSSAGELGRFGFKLIIPSRFGYLGTPMPAGATPATEADAWATLLDSLGVQRVAVVAFSAGTVPAFQFAMRHPARVTKLALFVPAAGGILENPPPGPPAWVMNIVLRWDLPMWLTRQASPKTMWKLVAVPPALVPALDADERAKLEHTVDEIFPVSRRASGIRYDAGNQSGREHLYPLEAIDIPTLFVTAEDDLYRTLPNARAAAARMPRATILSYPTGGHLLLGHGADVWPRVASFIR